MSGNSRGDESTIKVVDAFDLDDELRGILKIGGSPHAGLLGHPALVPDVPVAAASIRNLHRRKGPVRDYSDRSGFPKGREYSFGKAAQKPEPTDNFGAAPRAAEASKVTGETTPAVSELRKTLEPAVS